MWRIKSCLLLLLVLLLATYFANAAVGDACTGGTCDAANNEVCDLVTTVQCLCGAGYANNAGSCDPVDCGTAPTLTDGSRTDGGGTVYTDQATYACNTGYTLANTATIQCKSNAQWDALAATCTIVDCGVSPTLTNGARTDGGVTTFGATATYGCDSGYTIGGGVTIDCLSSGSWETLGATCTITDCGAVPTLTNGARSDGGTTTFGSTATYACNPGYDISGVLTIGCQTDGSWEAVGGTCIAKDCGTVPVAPTNGAAASNTGTTYQQTVTYACNSGYAFSGEVSGSISCQASASWETVPTCSAVDCGPVPAAPTNGAAVSNTGTTYQQTVTYTCNSGYAFSGGVSGTISCQASASWETVPTCSAVDCGTVPAAPTNGAAASNTGTTYKQTSTYTCNSGYAFSGGASGTISCQASGSWETVPTCAVDCGSVPAAPSNGAAASNTGTTYQQTVTYTCNSGYVFSGGVSGTISCLVSGSWDTVPTCSAVDSIVAIVAGVGGALVVILIVVIVVVICCYRKLLAMVKEMSDQPYREGRFPETTGRQGNIHSTNKQADQGGSSQISMTILDHQNQNMFSNVRTDSPRNKQSPPHPIITNNGQIGGQGNNPLHGHDYTGLAETELITPQSQYEYIDDYVMGDVTVSEDNYIHAE